MQQKEYPQVYELGLGSLIGDFFQNVKDTVTGVAKAVAPIAPYVLPFVMPGIGGAVGGKLGSFLASKLGQSVVGAGIGALAGQKPVDVAKNLAIQAALTGITGGFKGTPTKAPIDTGAVSTTTSFQDPGITAGYDGVGIEQISQQDPSFFQKIGGSTKDFFTEGYGARLNPFSDASMMNPKFQAGLDMGFTEKELFQMGIEPQRGFLSRIAPAATLASASIPLFMDKPEVDDTDYLQEARDDFQIRYSAEGGEMTGGVANNGQRIEHPDGKVKEHPRRIGEIAGPGTGTSDDIPAMLSDGEFVMTAQAVRNAGGGSRKAGAKNMYKLMKNLEKGGSLSEQSLGMVGRA
jgi:hypothetical protein